MKSNKNKGYGERCRGEG